MLKQACRIARPGEKQRLPLKNRKKLNGLAVGLADGLAKHVHYPP